MDILTSYSPQALSEFKALASEEWKDVTFPPDDTLKPILVTQEGSVIGGLSYIRYPHPNQKKLATWVNAVLVIPTLRSQGVGSALVKNAMQNLAPRSELFVYTEIPNLYLQLGWMLISTSEKNHTLKYTKE